VGSYSVTEMDSTAHKRNLAENSGEGGGGGAKWLWLLGT
jgi:hypothetical protein